ncbi:MAG: Flp pilus assembly protein CpaB [Chloroflexi bacterium]|nr:Flp pilus assembly protein CpaB [Chloroflexota bacterium]
MAQSITSGSLSRVNRRFLFLALILAGLSAVLIYTAISRSSGSSGGGPVAATVPVVVAKAAIPSGTTITAQMLDVRLVSQNAVAADAFTTVESVVGETVRFPMAANEQVLLSKIISAPAIGVGPVSYVVEEGHRALAIRTEPVIGAGGLVVEGDYVDIYWVPNDSPVDVEGAILIGEDIEVLAVDQTIIQIPPRNNSALERYWSMIARMAAMSSRRRWAMTSLYCCNRPDTRWSSVRSASPDAPSGRPMRSWSRRWTRASSPGATSKTSLARTSTGSSCRSPSS